MIENTTVLLQGFAIVFNQWCDLTGSCGLAPALVSLFPPPWSVISWWGGTLKSAIRKYFTRKFANAISQGFFPPPPEELIVKHKQAQHWFQP